MSDDLIEVLQELGFTSAEAKIYIALLKLSPATGYELAARSNVPRSAIYGVLKRLENQGLVNAAGREPARWVALPPADLEKVLEARFTKRLRGLKTSLESLAQPASSAITWTIQGYASVIEEAERLIAGTEKQLYGSLWNREATRLASPIREARRRGVEIIFFSFNPLDAGLGTVLSYGIDEHELEAYWPHKLILVGDQKRALLGGADQVASTRAVLTEERALVEMAVANLVLDITLLGQRRGVDTAAVVTRLTALLAPVEELAPRRKGPKKQRA
ncbi:MAG: TrmB family transcriptional regulator [Polyangiaceae bacterium]|nr:TrmB family transcriptional regulator [Polyangiaceae bacterium]